jgi:tRNA(fMet)-specific endonuclease VapC
MRRFLLDIGPAQDFSNDRNEIRGRVQAERQRGNRVGIATPVLGELWAGLGGSKSRERNVHRLYFGLSRLILWPYDAEASEEYGRLFNELKRLGRPMQQVDIQIAAIAFALGNCTVVSGDSDLKAITGLSVADWAAEAAGHGA